MEAKKCDRCGKFYLHHDEKIVIGLSYVLNTDKEEEKTYKKLFSYRTNQGEIGHSKYFDLCPDCADELKKWVNNGKDEKNK